MEKNDELDPRIQAIAEKLKKMRIKAGYTSYENFAVDNDLNRVQYWRIEKGKNFTLSYLLRLLDIHQISLKEFFKDLK
jgi:transcriptional regulator with XRE-family HTH domain